MIKIDTSNWKSFKISDIFEIKRPPARSQSHYCDGDIPFVASGNYNNGILKYLTPKNSEDIDKGNCITVSPIDGSSFYQENDFMGRGGAGSSIILLYNQNLNVYNGYFISTIIRIVCSKYMYSDMANKDTIANESILLPIEEINEIEPDWKYMTSYMCELEKNMSKKLEILKEILN